MKKIAVFTAIALSITLFFGACNGKESDELSEIPKVNHNDGGESTAGDPVADFSFTPAVIFPGDLFTLDAGLSYDGEDATSMLEVRWDLDNDGIFDTSFSTNKLIRHTFYNAGKHKVKVKVRDTDGNTDSITKTIDVSASTNPSISGFISFEKVPITPAGLDLVNLRVMPARRITVEAVRSSDNAVLDTAQTDDTGRYMVHVPSDTTVFVRAVAEIDDLYGRTVVTSPTDTSTIYSARGADIPVETSDITGEDYLIQDSTRASGPFNILNTILEAYRLAQGMKIGGTLPTLYVRWATDRGGRTYYDGGNQLFVMGQRDADSDEFDDHVVAHEYGHFIAENFYRDDTIGGPHNMGDKLDVRVAYSEGWANGFSGMALDDPLYLDSYWDGGSSSIVAWGFDLEDNSEFTTNQGYANEASFYAILWDLYDSNQDNNDTLNYGYNPIAETLEDGALIDQADVMYLYPFADRLIDRNPADENRIKSILLDENVPYPETAGNTFVEVSALPYSRAAVSITGNENLGYNKYVANHLYRFSIASTQNVLITTTCPSRLYLYLIRKGEILDTRGPGTDNTIDHPNLSPGTYVVNVMAWSVGTYNYDISITTY